ncbi:MAG: hypothetical protein HY550_01035 [Elusimicrobia bacterium]|nr:hypothetical protein [Elusimicrobiota bacterium]
MKKTAALLPLLACALRAAAAPYGAGFYDTSEYMMGKAAVNIIFVQSDGSIAAKTETGNWTAAKKNEVISEVTQAMSWWAARNSAASLSYVHNNTVVTTGYEPINCNALPESLPATACPNGEEDWIKQVMGKLGYTEADYGDRVFHYNNDMRLANSADWSFTIFLVDSQVDADGEFPDGFFAYAYLGGPFIVMTYDNGGYGIGNLDAVAAHETGHIFYALDEYAASNCTTTESSGYLNGPNTNCENGGSAFACIMRGDVPPYATPAVCQHTAHAFGWDDDDPTNGTIDILDLPPTTALGAYTPDPTTNTSPAYYGMAHSTAAYPNGNTYAFWGGPRTANNISIARIASVEYKVDGGAWTAATPRDGAFDQTIDSFTFTAAALTAGAHTMQARAKDNFGAYDASPASDSLTIDPGAAADIPFVYDGLSGDADYTRSKTTLSASWGASSHATGISSYTYTIGTAPGGSNTVAMTNVGTALSVTKTGLSLAEGADYYFSVRAYPNIGAASGISSSDGLRVDTTSPTATVLITSSVPVKTGAFSASLVVAELNALSGSPQLSFTASNGLTVPLTLAYVTGATWAASGYIESYHSTGTASFVFSASDPAGNAGSSVTAGGSFSIAPMLTGGSSGTVSNSDGNSATVPDGSYSGTLFISISTVAAAVLTGPDAASPDSRKVFTEDLAREFTARDGAGAPVPSFLAPVTITLSYPDDDNDGRIDMDLLRESTAWIYYLDPALGKWTPLPGVVRDASANTVSAQVSHFSVYSVRSAGVSGTELGSLKAYPNPCDLRISAALVIEGVPADAAGTEVHIYNEAGELVRTLVSGDGVNGLNIASWDGKLKGGARAATGLYIYLVKTSNYGKGRGKFFMIW